MSSMLERELNAEVEIFNFLNVTTGGHFSQHFKQPFLQSSDEITSVEVLSLASWCPVLRSSQRERESFRLLVCWQFRQFNGKRVEARLSHAINEKIIISVFSQPIITLFVRKFMAIVVNKRQSLKQWLSKNSIECSSAMTRTMMCSTSSFSLSLYLAQFIFIFSAFDSLDFN